MNTGYAPLSCGMHVLLLHAKELGRMTKEEREGEQMEKNESEEKENRKVMQKNAGDWG